MLYSFTDALLEHYLEYLLCIIALEGYHTFHYSHYTIAGAHTNTFVVYPEYTGCICMSMHITKTNRLL